ncbi:MAG: CDP-alcohol phosphatidyltransferase family protein [Candidatus Schekmanbacteria bacterium]|nr:CDP-alcohol phosphatidyltransferase family protein [Candidatus Schekmanbacteria bacterium]
MVSRLFKNPNLANNIANAITLTRIILTPVFSLCILYSDKHPFLHWWAVATMAVIVLTDCFDGAVAKRWGSPNTLGTFLDPLADKICIDVSFVVISIKYHFPIWVTIIVISRDLFVLGSWCFFLLVLGQSYRVVPHFLGKLMVAAQMVTILMVLLKLPEPAVCWAWRVTIFFSIASLLVYSVNLTKHRKKIE